MAPADRPPLWPHQREAVEAAVTTLAGWGRATVVAACGTGKTRVGAEVAASVAAQGRVLVVVPTLELLAQTLHAWRVDCGAVSLGTVVAVCSDHTVAYVRQLDLRAEGAAVTTDPAELGALTRGPGRVTVASTYQSLPTLVAAHANHGMPAWDVIVADEAHRTAGVAGRPWAAVHDNDLLPAARRLYMTATPRVMGTVPVGDCEVASMDDEATYGPICYRLPFAQAIELGLLADYRLVVAVVSDDEVRRRAEAHAEAARLFRAGGVAVSPRLLATQIAVLRAAARYQLRSVISYHQRVHDARWYAAALPHAYQLLEESERPARSVWAAHLDGTQTIDVRRPRLHRLRDPGEDLVCLSNVRVLTEGIDAPAVDAVVFADPRRSVIDAIQAVGRSLRRGGRRDKTATVIVPVLLDPTGDPEDALDGSAFAPVWQVIRALRAHDDGLAARLDQLRQHLGDYGQKPSIELPWLHLPGEMVPDTFVHAINVHAVRTATPAWEEHYGAARQFYCDHGHLRMSKDHRTPSGLRTGQWLANQRAFHARGALSPQRAARLEAIGMTWSPLDEQWDRAYAHAEAFHATHGHLRIPGTYKTPDGFGLGSWLKDQREHHRRGILDPRRRERLNHLGIDWEPAEAAWQRGLDALRAYHAEHGNTRVPAAHVTPGGFPLGSWVNNLRSGSTLPDDKVRQLDELGMTWSVLDEQWERAYAHAQAFHAQYGHLRIPRRYLTTDGFALGHWYDRQRQRARNGTLDPHRAARLAALGMTPTTKPQTRDT